MIKLSEFDPICRLELPNQAMRLKPRFPVIDAHSHLNRTADSASVVESMDRLDIKLIIDLDGVPDEDKFNFQLDTYVNRYPGRFALFGQVSLAEIDFPDWETKARRRIEWMVDKGIAGIKFHKTLGTVDKDRSGRYIRPDDPRLGIIWATAAELQLPVTIHVADPISFFDQPIDHRHERYEELIDNPDWAYLDVPCPRFHELLEAQEALLEANRSTTFIVAHVGSYAENLAAVTKMMDRHPNMYVDTAERIAELGRQPYTSREFLLRYQDRVIYGTDLVPNEMNVSGNYRFFETKDEYFPYNSFTEHNQGRWNIYGVYLPDEALHKIYCENILRVTPRIRKWFE